MRELSIFIDESGDFGPVEKHSPYYVLSLVLHDQSDDITDDLDKIRAALVDRGLLPEHGIHTGPLIRREQDYRLLDMASRRSIFRVLVDFVRTASLTHHSWVFNKRELGDSDRLVSRMSRELGLLIQEQFAYFSGWDRVVIYYDNGQKEITNLVNSVFNAHLSNVEVRRSRLRTTASFKLRTCAARSRSCVARSTRTGCRNLSGTSFRPRRTARSGP